MPSCGPTLKKYFKPLDFNFGEAESPLTNGMPALSVTVLAAATTEEKYALAS